MQQRFDSALRFIPSLSLFGLLAAAAAGCGAQPTQANASRQDPLSLVASADEPGRGEFDAMYVGVDETQSFALAVGISGDGSVVAYACDGVSKGLWLRGSWEDAARDKPLALDTDDGRLSLASAIIPRRGGDDMEEILPRRTAATLAMRPGSTPTELHFQLEPANAIAGMHRFSESEGHGSVTAGWVALNDGRIFGVDSVGGAVKSREIAVGNVDEDEVQTGDVDGSSVQTDAYLFNRMRCGRIVLRMSRATHDYVVNGGSTTMGNWDPCAEMRALRCPEYGFGLPHFC